MELQKAARWVAAMALGMVEKLAEKMVSQLVELMVERLVGGSVDDLDNLLDQGEDVMMV